MSSNLIEDYVQQPGVYKARLKVIGVRGGLGGGVGMKAPVASGIWDFSLFSCVFRRFSGFFQAPGAFFLG